MTEQLKALAEAAKGWTLNFVMNMTDEEPCEVGWKDEDGCFYPVITVDCENYFKSSGPLAEYIAFANPERILALIAENKRLQLNLRIKSEEHDCCAEDLFTLRTFVNALLHQIDIGDFVDSNGHSAKMLKPVHDLMKLLGETK